MKLYFLIVLSTIFFFNCSDGSPHPIEHVLSGKHELRRIKSFKLKSDIIGSYFLFSGSISGGGEKIKVSFAWKTHVGIYIITTLPLEDIRIKVDNTIKNPHVLFTTKRCNIYRHDLDITTMISTCVPYVTVVVKSEQWTSNIEMPLGDN